MSEVKYQQLMNDLRLLYKEGKLKDLRNKYNMCKWMLREEDRNNIEAVIGTIEQDPAVKYAIEVMGCKEIK